MQSSYSSSHQERKESSSSSVTKTLGEQSVTSVSESQSSQSQQKSSVVSAGQLSYHGDHGQAVFTGIKKEASSSESHEKSSSSSQRISSSNGAVTGKCNDYFEDIAGSLFWPIFEDFSKREREQVQQVKTQIIFYFGISQGH